MFKGILQEFHEDTSLFHPISNNPSGIGTFCSSSEETGSDSDDEEACDWIIPDEEGEEQGEADQQVSCLQFMLIYIYIYMQYICDRLYENLTCSVKKFKVMDIVL